MRAEAGFPERAAGAAERHPDHAPLRLRPPDIGGTGEDRPLTDGGRVTPAVPRQPGGGGRACAGRGAGRSGGGAVSGRSMSGARGGGRVAPPLDGRAAAAAAAAAGRGGGGEEAAPVSALEVVSFLGKLLCAVAALKAALYLLRRVCLAMAWKSGGASHSELIHNLRSESWAGGGVRRRSPFCLGRGASVTGHTHFAFPRRPPSRQLSSSGAGGGRRRRRRPVGGCVSECASGCLPGGAR